LASNLLKPSVLSLQNAFHFISLPAVEKYFKALLQEQGTAIPKTHDLEVLHALLFPHYPSLKAVKRGLDSLTEYAVDYRYPGVSANARKAKVALRLAGRVRREVRSILGLRGSA
jgi:HEPN domain-containing protein